MTKHLDDAALLTPPASEIGRLGGRAQVFAVVGVILSAIGYFVAGEAFWQSYLIGYIFWLAVTMGSLAILMIQYLSGGAWGLFARRVLEASTRNFPLMAVLFVPIWLKLPTLYKWARPESASDEVIHQKAAYLNVNFFTIRAVLFFAIWIGLAFVLNKWSKDQDEHAPLPPGPMDRRFRIVSGPGLVLYVATTTFMSVDWIMSLDPHWYSTIFGILTMGGQGLTAMAFTIIVLSRLVRFRPLSDVPVADNFHDLGKLMFAFLLLWAYFSVSQLIIIWSANLPEEIPFYLARLKGPWYPISVLILLVQFVLPFLLLLSRDWKRNAKTVSRIAMVILLMRIVDLTWTIGPVFREGSTLSWVDFAVVAGIGGIWLTFFFRNLAGRAVVPAHDPYYKDALAHGGH